MFASLLMASVLAATPAAEALDTYLLATTWVTATPQGGIAISECADADRARRVLADRPDLWPLADALQRRMRVIGPQVGALAYGWTDTIAEPRSWPAKALTASLHKWVRDHAVYVWPALEPPLREALIEAGMAEGDPGPQTSELPPGCTTLPCCNKGLPGCGHCGQAKCDCTPCQGDQCLCRRVDPDGVWLPCLPTALQCSLTVRWPKRPKIQPQDTIDPLP